MLVGAVSLAMSFNIAHLKITRGILGGGALLWIIVGGFAAWQGARILYAREDVNRATFGRMENTPTELRYFEGVRLDANLRMSLLLTAQELQKIKAQRGDLAGVLFGPTLEWMERDSPESILRGMPIWYDLGTSLQKSDTAWLIERFESKPIDRIFLHPTGKVGRLTSIFGSIKIFAPYLWYMWSNFTKGAQNVILLARP